MDNLSQVQAHPPYYVKHKEKGKFLFSGPFVTMGAAQGEISRCEYAEKGIEWEIVGLEEKNAYTCLRNTNNASYFLD